MMRSIKLWLVAGLLALCAPAVLSTEAVHGMAFDVYIRLKVGMSEAELLQRAGLPDYQSEAGVDTRSRVIAQDSVAIDPVSGRPVPRRSVVRSELSRPVKTWYYLPTVADPFTTAVTLTGGRISHLERKKKF